MSASIQLAQKNGTARLLCMVCMTWLLSIDCQVSMMPGRAITGFGCDQSDGPPRRYVTHAPKDYRTRTKCQAINYPSLHPLFFYIFLFLSLSRSLSLSFPHPFWSCVFSFESFYECVVGGVLFRLRCSVRTTNSIKNIESPVFPSEMWRSSFSWKCLYFLVTNR